MSAKMIRFLCLVLVVFLASVSSGFADTKDGGSTLVEYVAQEPVYTLTVPEKLAPGASGTVTLKGTWDDETQLTVTADTAVTLKKTDDDTQTRSLNVTLDDANLKKVVGTNASQTVTGSVAVADFEKGQRPKQGTWSGSFKYYVTIGDAIDPNYIKITLINYYGGTVLGYFDYQTGLKPGDTYSQLVDKSVTLSFEGFNDETVSFYLDSNNYFCLGNRLEGFDGMYTFIKVNGAYCKGDTPVGAADVATSATSISLKAK